MGKGRRALLGAVMAALTVMTGCGSSAVKPLTTGEAPVSSQVERVDEALTAALERFSARVSAQLLGSGEANVNLSPASLYMALALTAQGAQGELREQLTALLGTEDPEQAGAQLDRALNSDNGIRRVRGATSLWLREGEELLPAFAAAARDSFHAQVSSVRFGSKEADEAMARWVKEHTSGQLAPQLAVSDQTVMSLLNALDYKNEWMDRFLPEQSREGTFHSPEGEVTVTFMRTELNPHGYVRGEGYLRSELPLKDGDSMIFLLPETAEDMARLTGDSAALQQALFGGEAEYAHVRFQIPRFTVAGSLDLAQALTALGAGGLFDPGAELTGITRTPLFVSEVRQDSCIQVDEQGVSAAAFTQIMFASGALMVEETVEMTLDRPFIYALRQHRGPVMFVGVCAQPNQ